MMGAVLQFPRLLHAINPSWASYPDSWVWRRPDGMAQGFGLNWRENPGLANLLWLILDLEHPPQVFDCRKHPPYMLIHTYASPGAGTLQPVVDLAARLPLALFHRELSAHPEIAAIPRHDLGPLLIALAEGRMQRARA